MSHRGLHGRWVAQSHLLLQQEGLCQALLLWGRALMWVEHVPLWGLEALLLLWGQALMWVEHVPRWGLEALVALR